MKKVNYIVLLLMVLVTASSVQAQKRLTEATISYDIVINTDNAAPRSAANLLDGATSVIYLKGNSSRSEMVSALGTQATIIDGKTGNVTVLRDYGEQHHMINMTPADWKAANKKNEGITFTYVEEYKTIAGYKCQKAIGKLPDSTTYVVYFTKELVPVNKDFQYVNRNLPGLAMQYEAMVASSKGAYKVTYTVSNISFNPVPQAKFDLPKSGYRVLTYEESKQLGGGGN